MCETNRQDSIDEGFAESVRKRNDCQVLIHMPLIETFMKLPVPRSKKAKLLIDKRT